ncbi:MAG: Eco29kI family restriction endonuclease [Prosthecobacter sp.]|nr:Eco29kI family restriction endonuclease [Prosthecobacter sp.]
MSNEPVFNPLDKRNLGNSVVEALLESPELPLNEAAFFPGAGVYAIYYKGSFPHYKPLSEWNKKEGRFPIYVGKAIPKGGRKGVSTDASLDSTALSKRLLEHKASIECVESLDILDFTYRSLVVDDIWITLGEALVIQRFQPLWNQVVEGFGNHDPGSGRYEGMRPLWDELHPGRSWAARCKCPKLTQSQIFEAVAEYMRVLQNRS